MPANLCVRYEDSDLVVVDKPAGMHTAPLARGDAGTLLELVLHAFPEVGGVPGIKPVEPGLVHRLDRETSGLVIVARTAAAFQALRLAFDSGAVRKDYLAACADSAARADSADGVTPASTGQLRMESRFAPYGPGRRMVRPVLPGERSARLLDAASPSLYVTEGRILRRSPGRALVSAWILKGFRHQVRAHLAFLGFPILGDPLYGVALPDDALPDDALPDDAPPGGVTPRMYLHAARVEIPHPGTGARLVVESPAPAEFMSLFEPDKGASP